MDNRIVTDCELYSAIHSLRRKAGPNPDAQAHQNLHPYPNNDPNTNRTPDAVSYAYPHHDPNTTWACHINAELATAGPSQ